MIVRRERPHPGAQLSFTDHDGHRFLATLTDLPGDPADLERLHRARANTEDRIRAGKQTGLENLPFRDFDHNAIWLELSLIAQDLIAWTQHLTLDGDLAVCEPKTLRYRLLHTAARLVFHARRATLRLPRAWPWANALAAAFTRLAALPPRHQRAEFRATRPADHYLTDPGRRHRHTRPNAHQHPADRPARTPQTATSTQIPDPLPNHGSSRPPAGRTTPANARSGLGARARRAAARPSPRRRAAFL